MKKSEIRVDISYSEAKNVIQSNIKVMSQSFIVKRMSFDKNKVTRNTMKMMSLNELWVIPNLVGRMWEIKAANQERYLYLKNVDAALEFLLVGEERQQLIRETIRFLNVVREASKWKDYRRYFRNVGNGS